LIIKSNRQGAFFMKKVAKKVVDYLKGLLLRHERFTGQVTVEIHFKEGEVKDVYITNRSKV